MDIKKLREEKDWTREDLASQMGTSFMTIYRWEEGISKPRRIYRNKLEEIFGEIKNHEVTHTSRKKI